MTRAEHLAWAKERALGELGRGGMAGATASMVSDLQKHPELHNHAGILLFLMCSDAESTRKWIEGFN